MDSHRDTSIHRANEIGLEEEEEEERGENSHMIVFRERARQTTWPSR